jgi:ferredoxin-type protein NapH
LALDKKIGPPRYSRRLLAQLAFFITTNSYFKGFAKGTIFRGQVKALCLPGLNCYSCPGALGSCPMGAMQGVLAEKDLRFPFYVTGFLLVVGAVFGRFVCGWLCPFGLFQDVLHKIPFKGKITKVKGDKYLKYLKYFILIVFVILLPMLVLDLLGQGTPWFCKWICPSGTLMAGWPLAILNEGIRGAIGWLFAWKSFILIAVIILSVIIYRPFCRYGCPLGAIYGLFNPVAIYGYQIEENKCTDCGRCQKSCKLDIPVKDTPNSLDCIRCGNCKKACPEKAIINKSYRNRIQGH